MLVGAVSMLLFKSRFGESKTIKKQLKITISEQLDYSGLFDDLFDQYTSFSQLKRVKTSNMGSLFQLQYDITLNDETEEKSFIDELRCRNGNLDIICGYFSDANDVL